MIAADFADSSILLPMDAAANGRTLEGLIDEFARVVWDPEQASVLVLRAGFPTGDLPAFKTPRGFWSLVVWEADNGKIRGGVQALVEEAAKQYPGNVCFAGYREATATTAREPSLGKGVEEFSTRLPDEEPPMGSKPGPSSHRRTSIDNRGAVVGQQVIVHGDATFGPSTINGPGSPSPIPSSAPAPRPVTCGPETEGLVHAFANSEVVAFVGPGVSVAGGLPSWSQLASLARDRAAQVGVSKTDLHDIGELIASGELVDAFTELSSRLGGAEFTRLISAHLDDRHGPGGGPIDVPELARALADLAPRLRAVITTNLDAFLERAFPPEWEVFERPVGDLARRRHYIAHLHGVVRDRRTWVLTRSDYDQVTVADPCYSAYLSAMFRSHPLLFVGFEFGDRDFERIVEKVRTLADGQPAHHFALVRESEITGARRRKLGEAGITLIGYDKRAQLPEILRRLAVMEATC